MLKPELCKMVQAVVDRFAWSLQTVPKTANCFLSSKRHNQKRSAYSLLDAVSASSKLELSEEADRRRKPSHVRRCNEIRCIARYVEYVEADRIFDSCSSAPRGYVA